MRTAERKRIEKQRRKRFLMQVRKRRRRRNNGYVSLARAHVLREYAKPPAYLEYARSIL